MKTVHVVPGTNLKDLIARGASVGEIAAEVKRSAEKHGLSGEVGFLIEMPDQSAKAVEVPTTFREVA